MYKTIFPLSLLMVVACTNLDKEKTTLENVSQVADLVKEDGVIISPQAQSDTLKGSLKAYAESQINGNSIWINYYSPAVRGRVIWGGLVPYDNVWVTGAHKATKIKLSKDILIGESRVAAGEYALFTIPGKAQWTVIINKDWNQHLTDNYDVKKDVLRLTVTPQASEIPQERLRYFIHTKGENSATISMQWDKIHIEIPVTFPE